MAGKSAHGHIKGYNVAHEGMRIEDDLEDAIGGGNVPYERHDVNAAAFDVDGGDDARKQRRSEKAEKLATHYASLDAINRHISEAMRLIKLSQNGIHLEEIRYMLSLSQDESLGLSKRMKRIDGIYVSQGIPYGDAYDPIFKYVEPVNPQKITRQYTRKNNKTSLLDDQSVGLLAIQMVNNYASSKKKIHKGLRKRLTKEFIRHKTIKSVMDDNPEFTKDVVLLHVQSSMRLPKKLKDLESDGLLHPDPKCSLQIALFATDCCEWDGDADGDAEVIDLALSISRHMSNNKDLDGKFRSRKRFRMAQKYRKTTSTSSVSHAISGTAIDKRPNTKMSNLERISCPRCSRIAESRQEIVELFGLRKVNGVVKPQSWCKTCRRRRGRDLSGERTGVTADGVPQWPGERRPEDGAVERVGNKEIRARPLSSRTGKLYRIVEGILRMGKPHKIADIYQAAFDAGYEDVFKTRHNVRSALDAMRRAGRARAIRKGVWQST